MKKRKGSLLQRMMAVLLSAVLVTGMVSNAAPVTVLAQETDGQQENTGGNGMEPAAGDTKPEEKTETTPAEGTGSGEQEKTDPEGQEKPGTTEGGGETEKGDDLAGQEPGGGMEEGQPKPENGAGEAQPKPENGTEEETEPGTVSGNDAAPEAAAEPQSVMMAALPAPQADNIVFGEGWVLDADGKLIIASNDGVVKWKEDADGWLQNRQKVTSLELGSGVTTITDSAFSSCGLTEIEIPDTVTSIGESAFAACSSLTSVTLSDNMTNIGKAMFRNCSSLTDIVLPERVTSIGESAFSGCGKLREITIPEVAAEIGSYAFNKCFLLERITFLGDTPPSLGDRVFGKDFSVEGGDDDERCGFVKTNAQGIHVPEGKAQTYKEAWPDWASYIADDALTPPVDTHEHNGVTFTAWDKTDSLPTDAGNYYLTEDVNLPGIWNVPDGTTSLCLNGKTISALNNFGKITIPASCTLNLYGCKNAGTISFSSTRSVQNEGTFNMYGGKLSGSVYNDGTFYMYDGKISLKAQAPNGGVVNKGSFLMYGGEISGNRTSSKGGGVNAGSGTFTVGGSAVIAGNNPDNVWVGVDRLIEIDEETPLSGSAKIGITTETKPTAGNPVNITGENGADYSQYFQSDNPDYEIVNGENNVVQLAVKHTHEADTAWQQDADGHWHSCKNGCGEKLDYAVHTFEENKCKVCGYIKSSTETHEHNDVTFTAWTATDSLPDAAGNYYLTENVTLSETWDIPGETTLCLNGKTISASGTDEYRVITIPESCTLHLYDCQNAGNITGGREGGVINFGTFNMYGGKISGNSGEVSGGGVNNQGAFGMYGGEISGNRADNFGDFGCVGGGVYIGDGTFAMYGGKISGNTASTGGGVGSVSIIGTFLTIIYDEPLTIGGGAEINGNTCDGKENNVCLNDGQIITIESGNPLSGSAKIGVTTKTAPTDGSPVNITEENGTDYSSFFTSDNADYEIANGDSNVVQLAVRSQSYTVTVNGGTGGGDYAAGDTVTIRANAPASGKQFNKWVVDSGSVTLASATSSTTTFTMPAEAVTVTATYKNKSGGGHSGGGSGSGGDHSGDSGNADGGNNDNGGSDNGSGSSGGNDSMGGSTENTGGTGAGMSGKPGASGTGQPRVKQEKEGNIRKEVRVEGENTLDAAVETPLPELADIVLTKEEKQKAAGGTDVKIVLDVKDASAVVSAADKALVEKALNGSQAKGYTLGQYLDINLFKVIGDSRSAITETNRKITITIDVPDSLKNTDAAKIRTFAVIRVHDGEAELLADLDDNAGTITIETDRFSTYAVVYKDTAGGNSGRQSGNGKPGVVRVSAKSDGKNPGGGQDGEPKTGDSMPIELSATLAMIAGFAYLLLYFADRERGMTEETKRELVSRLVAWAKQGGRIRKYLALAAIFILLVYYHSIGKKTCAEWKEIYGE